MKRVGSIYLDVLRTYLSWAPLLLVLAVAVFVPVGLVHSLTISVDVDSIDFGSLLKASGSALALSALVITGLLGEVFYTGAVAISLTHSEGDRRLSLREVAKKVAYRRLIVVDVAYGLIVTVGLLLLVAPGVAAFVYLGLAAPVVEIERRGARAAFARSVELIRGSFWVVLAVLAPIEIIGDAITRAAADLAQNLLGESFFTDWLADVLANVAFTPFFAVGAVLITVRLIREKGDDAELHSEPIRA